jgi:hypothetical protein
MVQKETIRRFSDAARRHGAHTLEGDAKRTNRAYKSLIGALKELREAPDHGVALLSDLLSDDDPSVGTWAALFLMPFDEPNASAALRKIAENGTSLVALGARVTFREWQAGRLRID